MRAYLLPAPTPNERGLAKAIAGGPPSRAEWSAFASGELFVRVPGSSRGPACVIGRLDARSDDLVRTLLIVDALRRSGTRVIDVAVPHFPYARQDRAARSGDAAAGLLIPALLAAAGASRLVTAELHSDAVRRASPIPIVGVSLVTDLAAAFLRLRAGRPFVAVAPDAGAKGLASAFAAVGGMRSAWFEKRRPSGGAPLTGRLHGAVQGSAAVIVDDTVGTGRTVAGAVAALRKRGATEVALCATHAAFALGAADRLRRLRLSHVIVSDTVPLRAGHGLPVTVVASAAPLAAVLHRKNP